MLSNVNSCSITGIKGYIVEVETDVSNGLPCFEIVGLGDAAVKESRERVRAAVRNSGYEFPIKRITVNLAPAHLRKEGSSFDLAMVAGILNATGQINSRYLMHSVFVGEVSLNGNIRPVRGILPAALSAKEKGYKFFYTSCLNAPEAAVVKDIDVFPVNNIRELVEHLNGNIKMQSYKVNIEDYFKQNSSYKFDFKDVKGFLAVLT